MENDLTAYQDYLKEYKEISANTAECYARDARQFVDYLRSCGIGDYEAVKSVHFTDYQADLQSRFCNTTVARKLVSVRVFWNYLYRSYRIDLSFLEQLKTPRTERKLPGTLTVNEMNHLVEEPSAHNAKEIRDRAILELMYATGIRVSELVTLQREQIDLQMDSIVCGNGIHTRNIPFGNMAREALIRYLEESRMKFCPRENERTVFLNHSGEPLSRQGIFKILLYYADRAGIEKKVTPDMIRHSFAMHLLENGADVRSVQKMMGHTDIATTQKYAKNIKVREREEYKRTHPRA